MQLSGTLHPCQITAAIAFPEGRIFSSSIWLVEHIDAFREAVRQVRARRPFHIDAWVVLPDHTHCIWTLPPGDSDYSARWKAIKIAFAKSLPKTERLSAVRGRKGERGIWQRRFWEHTIRDERDYAAHATRAYQSVQARTGATGKRMALLVISSVRDRGDLSG